MTLDEFAKVLESTGLPVTYHSWPEGDAPELPFLCYLTAGTDVLAADGGVYLHWNRVRVELYTALKDPATEAKVEKALEGFVWSKSEVWIKDERCFLIGYEVEA